MKKNELVHLHALLAHVKNEYVERGVADGEAFEPYRQLGVTPVSVQASRKHHEEAVRTLAGLLAEADDPSAEAAVDAPASPL